VFSIPNIPLIEIKPVPAQEFAVFLLKGRSAMILLLAYSLLYRWNMDVASPFAKGRG